MLLPQSGLGTHVNGMPKSASTSLTQRNIYRPTCPTHGCQPARKPFVAQRQSCWGSNAFPRGGVHKQRGSKEHSGKPRRTQTGRDPKQVRIALHPWGEGHCPPSRSTCTRTSIVPENQLWTRPRGGGGGCPPPLGKRVRRHVPSVDFCPTVHVICPLPDFRYVFA